MNAFRRTLALAVGLALAVTMAGCRPNRVNCTENPSDASCPPPPPPPSPTPEPPTVLDRGEGQLPELTGLFRTVATTRTGAFDVTVDWTFATNDVDIFIARGTCSFEQFVEEQCAVLAAATSSTAKPERLRLANQPAGTYSVVIVNFGPGDESIAYQVVFTPGNAAASLSDTTANVRTAKPTARLRGSVEIY
jgi:hypothetical protein